ncbi:unnamed protein product [Gadus morhua 'NCC']
MHHGAHFLAKSTWKPPQIKQQHRRCDEDTGWRQMPWTMSVFLPSLRRRHEPPVKSFVFSLVASDEVKPYKPAARLEAPAGIGVLWLGQGTVERTPGGPGSWHHTG